MYGRLDAGLKTKLASFSLKTQDLIGTVKGKVPTEETSLLESREMTENPVDFRRLQFESLIDFEYLKPLIITSS